MNIIKNIKKRDYIFLFSIIMLLIFFSVLTTPIPKNYGITGSYNYFFLYIRQHFIRNFYILIQQSSISWWENGWIWTAIGTVAGIIIGIIKLLLNYMNNKKSDKRYRKRN